ncbi:MAG: hypothetical protein QOD00_2344 [Blastocatellia bacterium]|nr:hypothetical protein [Blastocatellia bacterium]
MMDDYLWDKSGEPDEEVERLEELLGALRYQPRELELPETLQLAHAPRRNYWPGLAAAAALILMGLAGLWLVQHRRVPVSQQPPVLAQAPQPEVKGDTSSGEINGPTVKAHEKEAIAKVSGPRRQSPPHPAVKRRPGVVGPNMTGVSTGGHEEEVADAGTARRLEQQREQAEGMRAKEELMLALQVASTKLNHAQRKAKGSTPIPGPDSKPSAPASIIPWNKSR